MLRKANSKLNIIHLLDPLSKRLSQIPDFPLTVLEAPSGFGKTTAVREYFKANKKDNQKLVWFTLGEENTLSEWEVFCSAIDNGDVGARLANLSIPYDDGALFKMHHILNGMECEEETFIVLDNHQFARGRLPIKYVECMCQSLNPKIHFIVITQRNAPASPELVSSGSVNHIKENYLVFKACDIREYFRMCSLHITDAHANDIYKLTEGWVAAIYLTLLKFAEQGRIDNANDIIKLIETAVWKKIDVYEQSFLLRLCFFDSFDAELVRFMNGTDNVDEKTLGTLKNTGFVYYDADKNRYFVHNILQRYAKNVFNVQSRDFRTDVMRLTAKWHEQNHQNFIAIRYYSEIDDFESILKINLATSDFTANASAENKKLLLRILEHCPRALMMKYPRVLPVFAFSLFVYNETDRLYCLCDEIQGMLSKNKNMTKREKDRLSGELVFIVSFLSHNDFIKMADGYRHAHRLMNGATSIINKRGPWTFGSPSVLYMFYRYNAEKDVLGLEQNIAYSLGATNGHGTGADAVMRGELMLNQGDLLGAEITAHRAAYMAENEEQLSIYLCAVFLLAQISIAKGDRIALEAHIKILEERAEQGKAAVYHTMVSLCRGFLGSVTNDVDAIPAWLSANETESRVRFMTLPYTGIIFSKSLLLSGEYTRLAGIGRPLQEKAAYYPNALAQIYIAIHLSAAFEALGDGTKALESLKTALSLALPDCIHMPFAQNYGAIKSIFDRSEAKNEDIAKIQALHDVWRVGVERVKQKNDKTLSEREREVALWCGKGLTTKEIADALFLSPETVKMNLKKVFAKLGIKSRVELKEKIF